MNLVFPWKSYGGKDDKSHSLDRSGGGPKFFRGKFPTSGAGSGLADLFWVGGIR